MKHQGTMLITALLATLLLAMPALAQSAEAPLIPAWAGEQSAITMVFVPNGDICVLGPFGAVAEDAPASQAFKAGMAERWYRYSHDGELLGVSEIYGQGLDRACWMFLYWPGLADKCAEMAALSHTAHFSCGTVSFGLARSVSGRPAELEWNNPQPPVISAADIVASYDYLGNELDPQDVWINPDHPRDSLPYLMHPQPLQLYAEQLAAGLVDNSSASPFEGTASGPVRAAVGYETPDVVHFQYYNSGNGDRYPRPLTVIRDIDDPENPYLGQYTKWDRLCYENHGVVHQQMQTLFEAQETQLKQNVASAKAAGQTLEDFIEEHGAYGTELTAADLESANFISISNYVNAQGWLVPQLVSQALFQHVLDKDDLQEKRQTYSELERTEHVLKLSSSALVSPAEQAEWMEYSKGFGW